MLFKMLLMVVQEHTVVAMDINLKEIFIIDLGDHQLEQDHIQAMAVDHILEEAQDHLQEWPQAVRFMVALQEVNVLLTHQERTITQDLIMHHREEQTLLQQVAQFHQMDTHNNMPQSTHPIQ